MYKAISINEAFIQFSNDIKNLYPVNEAINITSYIFEDLLQITDFRSSSILTEKNYFILKDATNRLLAFEPVQYITNRADFMGLQLYVDHNVLIPRPETEELVDLINKDNPKNIALNILDIGTGSGCIAIALAKTSKQWTVTGWDISEKALEVAKTNANNLSLKIDFKHQDVINVENLPLIKYDIIVSNPPYIGTDEKGDMGENVLKYEPKLALFAGDDPLLFYRAISNLGSQILSLNGKLYFELNPIYSTDITIILKEAGYSNIEIFKDLEGKNRMLKAIWI